MKRLALILCLIALPAAAQQPPLPTTTDQAVASVGQQFQAWQVQSGNFMNAVNGLIAEATKMQAENKALKSEIEHLKKPAEPAKAPEKK